MDLLYTLNHNPYYHADAVKHLRSASDPSLFIIKEGVVYPVATIPNDHRILDAVMGFVHVDLIAAYKKDRKVDRPIFVAYDPHDNFFDILFYSDVIALDDNVLRVQYTREGYSGVVHADVIEQRREATKESIFCASFHQPNSVDAKMLQAITANVKACHLVYWADDLSEIPFVID